MRFTQLENGKCGEFFLKPKTFYFDTYLYVNYPHKSKEFFGNELHYKSYKWIKSVTRTIQYLF